MVWLFLDAFLASPRAEEQVRVVIIAVWSSVPKGFFWKGKMGADGEDAEGHAERENEGERSLRETKIKKEAF